MTVPTPSLLVSTKEARRLLGGISVVRLHELRSSNLIQAKRLRPVKGSRWYWVRSSLERFVREAAA